MDNDALLSAKVSLYKALRESGYDQKHVKWLLRFIKYYVRFVVSGIIIFLLIQQRAVNPIGLFIGLSVVVVSIMLATVCELKKVIFKEAP